MRNAEGEDQRQRRGLVIERRTVTRFRGGVARQLPGFFRFGEWAMGLPWQQSFEAAGAA